LLIHPQRALATVGLNARFGEGASSLLNVSVWAGFAPDVAAVDFRHTHSLANLVHGAVHGAKSKINPLDSICYVEIAVDLVLLYTLICLQLVDFTRTHSSRNARKSTQVVHQRYTDFLQKGKTMEATITFAPADIEALIQHEAAAIFGGKPRDWTATKTNAYGEEWKAERTIREPRCQVPTNLTGADLEIDCQGIAAL
jgi:hypothetical protein